MKTSKERDTTGVNKTHHLCEDCEAVLTHYVAKKSDFILTFLKSAENNAFWWLEGLKVTKNNAAR